MVDGTVYVGASDNHLYVLNSDDGTEEWSFKAGDKVGTPMVVNDTVYFASDCLYALNATDGSERWSTNFSSGTPAVADDSVYVSANSGVCRIDARTGDDLWFRDLDAGCSAPTVVDDTVYISCDGYLYALEAVTGEVQWSCETDYKWRTSPAVVDGTVYAGSYSSHSDGRLYAIDSATGNKHWSFHTEENVDYITSPMVVDETVYFGYDKHLYAIDTGTGVEQWRLTTGDRIYSPPVVLGGNVYIGSRDNHLYALSGSKTGATEDRMIADRIGAPTIHQ